MCVVMQREINKLYGLDLLDRLLFDMTTERNIIWATDAYNSLGNDYRRDKEMSTELLVREPFKLMSRVEKARNAQSERTKTHAEVFTPLWLVKKMSDHMETEWFGHEGAFGDKLVVFPAGKTWQDYVDSRRMELACGEGPFLVSRYDVSNGERVSLRERVGILDRKLRVVGENAANDDEWLEWAYRAVQATYGYEFQGDNLLLTRLNVFLSFEEYMQERLGREPNKGERLRLMNILAWNIWQMDGLSGTIPYCKLREAYRQLTMDEAFGLGGATPEKTQPPCRIFDWRANHGIEYITLNEMKFDFVIGNPPYQDETVGNQKTFAPPIYHLFMDEAFKVADHVELIHPARFLFNAGGTPKAWNEKMLADSHFKVLSHEQDSSKVFENTSIKGGVAITYRDTHKEFGAIEIYTAFEELNCILKRVKNRSDFAPFSQIIYNRGLYRFSEKIYSEHSAEMKQFSDSRIGSSSFERLSELFTAHKPDDGNDYVQIYGLLGTSRVYRWFRKDYVNNVENLNKYKVFLPKANGSGALGEVLSTPVIGQPVIGQPVIGQPVIGHTETFLSIGCFETEREADACLKYVKTKFARVMLGVLKITQDNSAEKWKYVPLQDFTSASDIDWAASIPEIDRQLYAKYGLDEQEIRFIESHVKEMS